jgi:hypothetical protein
MLQEHRTQFQFSLASLMLIVTLTAVLLGVGGMAPGLGIALAVLASPALVRTSVVAALSRARGKPMSVGAKVALFVVSLIVAVVIAIAAGAAFFVSCLAGAVAAPGGGSLIVGMTCGLLGALSVAGLLLWAFWLRKRRKGNVP